MVSGIKSAIARMVLILFCMVVANIIGILFGAMAIQPDISAIITIKFWNSLLAIYFLIILYTVTSCGILLIFGEIQAVFYIFLGKKWLFLMSISLILLKAFIITIIGLVGGSYV
jgi:hypothetical protein